MFKRPVVLLSVLAVFLCLSMLFVSCTQDASVETKQYGSIQGRVRYSNGSDHSGITVSLDKAEGQDGLSSIVNGIGTRNIVSIVSTKKDGSFSFSNVAPGMYTIYASSDDSVEKTVSTNVVVKGSETAKAADLRLTATGTVSGYMLIDGNTSGNGDYLVSLAGTTFMSVTDNSGYYSISGVPAGVDYQLVVSKGGLIAYDVAHVSVTAHGLTNAGVIILASTDMVSDAGTDELVWKGSFSSSSAIQNPRRNWVYYNTIEKCYYIYDGMKWTPITDEEPEESQGSAVSEVANVSGTVGENLVYGGDFERGGDHDVMEDGATLEVVANKGIDGSNALRVQQTEFYGEVYIDITKYYGQGKSYYVEASFKNNDSTKVSDLTARIDYWVVSGAVVKAVDSQWWEGYYDCDEIYTGEFLSNNEAKSVFGIETDGYEKTITDDGYVTIRGIIPASEIDRVLVETTNQYGSGEPTMYLLSVVFYVGSFLNQDGYNYYLDNVVIKDLNTEIPRQGRTYDPSVEPEEQDDEPAQKWYRVKFDAQGGTYMAPVSVCEGESVSKPADPVNEGYVFSGWFRDAACTQAYDFNSSVYGNITLYAKWVKNSTPSPYVPTDDSMVYRLTATHGVAEELYTYDKFIVEFRNTFVKPGDVISFKYRSNRDFSFLSIRGDKKWVYEDTSTTHGMTTFEEMADGWTYVTYVFPEYYTDGSPVMIDNAWFRIDFGLRVQISSDSYDGINVGDILEIKGLALNGELLEISEENVPNGVAPTFEIVNASDWRVHTVTFETLGGSTIAPITVEFGKTIDMPAEPTKGGVLFTGWFEDAGYTVPFDSEMPITEDKVLYARWTSPRTVTFNSMGGSSVASVKVPMGWTIEKPEDPKQTGLMFVGWYTDPACTNAFDFGSSITQNITLYAKWAEASNLILDFNYSGAPQNEALIVGRGVSFEEPKRPSRAGYNFGGWYLDAECTTAFDFSAGIEEDTTIYAKWIEPNEVYRFTATQSSDRFQFRWKASYVPEVETLNVGDVLSFMVRFLSGEGAVLSNYRLRTASSEVTIVRDIAFGEQDSNGWIPVMIVFPEGVDYSGNGLFLSLYTSGQIIVGDIMEIMTLTYNGVDLPFTDSSSCGSYSGCYPTLEIVALSDWTAHRVTFETLGGTEIAPIIVDFGRRIEMPEDPNKSDVLFTGWFEDAGYTVPFDSEMPITEDKVLYARWTSPRTVTFNSMGGSSVASVKVPMGWTIEKPEDPKQTGLMFVGWYTDPACTNAFDFGSAVTQNITLYAKWAEASRLTLDFNYQGAPQDEVLLVGRGAPIEDPSIPIRAGYYFDGWYEEAGCTTAFDFTNGINEETTIYAKWIEPSIYKYTATSSHERFAFRFKETTVEMLNNLNPGDVISFQVRFTSTTTAPYQYRLRTRVNENNICERTSFDSPNADGWYSITVTVPESIVNGQGLYVQLYGNGAWAIGDICEIRGLAYNGVEIPITDSTSSGLYPGIEATLEIIDAI